MKKWIDYPVLIWYINRDFVLIFKNAHPWTWDQVLLIESISGDEVGEGNKNH